MINIKQFLYFIFTIISYLLQHIFNVVMMLIVYLFIKMGFVKFVPPLVKFWATGILALIGKKVHVINRQNHNEKKKYILVTNHTSIYDIPTILAFYPQVSFIGKEYLTRIPIFGKLIQMLHFIPIDQNNKKKAIDSINKSIKKTEHITVAIFPEGTRTLDGKLNKFKKGFYHIFKNTRLEILPVTIKGLFAIKPKTRFNIIPKGKIEVVIHNPIKYEDMENMNDFEIIDYVKSIIESELNGNSK